MMTILTFSSWNAFLDCACLHMLDEDSSNTPPYPIMGEPRLAPSSRIHCKLQANDIFRDGSSWTCTSHSSKCVDQSWLHSLHFVLINIASFLLFFFSSFRWCLGGKHECSLNLLLQATLAISSTLDDHLFGSHLEYHFGHHFIFFFQSWNQHMVFKHCLWKSPTRIAQCKY